MKKIKLTQNKVALVDDADYEYLSQWKWTYSNVGAAGYATRSQPHLNKDGKIVRKTIYMHSEIVEKKISTNVVDHKNGKTLDNRRENLREATQAQNLWNRKAKGVYQTRNKKWIAMIQANCKPIRLGTFKTKSEALVARRLAEKLLFGEFAPNRKSA